MTDELAKIDIHDHKALGQLVSDYATGTKPWPETLAALKSELAGIATVPDHLKALQVIQPSEEVLLLRLPPRRMIEQSLENYSTGDGATGPYPLPGFYDDGDTLSNSDFLLHRVADYTIAVCT